MERTCDMYGKTSTAHCFEGKSKKDHLEDLVVEEKVSKWILNRMRVRGLDPTGSG
jgi:hypothetical protein